jgi:hypothetical protein
MARYASEIQSVSFEGEIVEILEEAGGHRVAKIVLTAPVVVDLTGERLTDAHLGDHVVVRGWIAGVGSHKEDV